MTPEHHYIPLQHLIKLRLIDVRQILEGLHSMFAFEKAALQMRKIVETIAYSSIILSETQGKALPERLRTTWDAKLVFKWLRTENINAIPGSVVLTQEKSEEPQVWRLIHNTSTDVDVQFLLGILGSTRNFLHAYNPYNGWDLTDARLAPTISNNFRTMRRQHMQLWNRYWQHAAVISDNLFFVSMGSPADGAPPWAMSLEETNRRLGAHERGIDPSIFSDWVIHPTFLEPDQAKVGEPEA